MSQSSPATNRGVLAASAPEQSPSGASSPGPGPAPATAPPPPASATKLRSCVVCRSRKVRCDKLSPCSNCRRANIPCVVPSNDRPPRWARRLDRITNNVVASAATAPQAADPGADQVMDRLRNLEGLVKELSSQLEQANAAAASARGGSSGTNSAGMSPHEQGADHQASSSSTQNTAGLQKHFGRLVLQDASGSRYVSSGFWSRVSDELDGLKMDTEGLPSGDSDSSEDEDSPGKSPSTQELDRAPSERHSFLFRHNLDGTVPDLRKLRPLPSQIPFLVNTFEENVNFFYRIVHMPTLTRLIRDMRRTDLSPSNEALLFSIYYAAITSMEEEDVMTNFGSTKSDLNLKYRLGLEYALAKADFLNAPDLTMVQAFTVFLFLVRRHDSPRFVWMMTGLVIRMAQAIGLHRDGSNFPHLSPYEVEMRRRAWKALCTLDIRSSEDQGSDLIITSGNSDTKMPLNINDADIDPETKETPLEREGITDISIALVSFEMCEVVKKIMTSGPNLEYQSQLLSTVYDGLERRFLRYATEGNIAYWVGVTATRLVIAKLTLFIYLPILFSNPDEHFSEEIRNKLLVAAIEVAEYNHALNAEEACRQWRWVYQTYTHWHAIVYLLIETSRRQWSPMVERAWIALHSSWLIPSQSNLNKNLRIWIPLRKLMAKARKHREAELKRLQGNAPAIAQLEKDDQNIPIPGSSGPFAKGNNTNLLLEHWRNLVNRLAESNNHQQAAPPPETDTPGSPPVSQGVDTTQHNFSSGSGFAQQNVWPNASFESFGHQHLANKVPNEPHVSVSSGQTEGSYNTPFAVPTDWSGGQSIGPGFTPWLWADTDPAPDVFAGVDVNMDLDTDINWNNWLESAAGMDLNLGTDTTRGSWPRPMQ